MDTCVENVFNSYPVEYREPLMQIRELIYNVASKIPEVGELEESLKWGATNLFNNKSKNRLPNAFR